MSAKMEEIVHGLLDTMKQAGTPKTSSYDATAVVRRIEDGYAWVHFYGGEEETPVRLTINCKPGDMVQVRVSGGTAFLVGNGTAPPTDDTRANVAIMTADIAAMQAERASAAANSAIESASIAAEAASDAQESADAAQVSANAANRSANNALNQLSIVEDVVGTLNWISDHSTYSTTSDTEVVPGKMYFIRIDTYSLTADSEIVEGKTYYTRSGSGTTEDPYVFTEVEEPDVSEINTYYEITATSYDLVTNPEEDPSENGYYEISSIDEAVSNFIQTHVALTDAGLWIVLNNNGYKLLLTNTAVKVFDQNGAEVSSFGESIDFSSSRSQHIGGEDAYIEWYDSNNDDIPDALRIVGAHIIMESGDDYETEIENIKSEVSDYEQLKALYLEFDPNDPSVGLKIGGKTIGEHYELTTDESIVSGKTYYTRSGTGTSEDPYVYTEVDEPDVSEISTYYELIDESSFNTTITNTQMSFNQNGEKIAYINGLKYHIRRGEIEQALTVGTFEWRVESIDRENDLFNLVLL